MEKPLRFGDWLKERRLASGLTQQHIADATGIGRPYIISIEKNRVDLPIYETRQKIHAALGTSDDDLRKAGIIRDAIGRVIPTATATAEAHPPTVVVGLSGGDTGSGSATGELETIYRRTPSAKEFFASLNNEQASLLLDLFIPQRG